MGIGFDLIFNLLFIVFIAVFLFILIGGILQWRKNNHSPRITVHAVVKTKRMKMSGGRDHSASTWYYATFEFESGDRMEFLVNGEEYGRLAEGDQGLLTFQGTRYIQLERL